MKQIFHIFRKDIRHHWPEVLVSLLLLLTYVWTNPRQWMEGLLTVGDFPAQFLISIARFLLPISWIFIVFRIVHDEPLVGNRQFWVTRPYDWKRLLVAKLLFALICIHLPVFLAQIVLLRLAGFPAAVHILGLFQVQFGLASLLTVAMLLAVITRTLSQAIVVVLACIVAGIAITFLFSLVPNHDVSYVDKIGDAFTGYLFVFAIVFVILRQYAVRKTRESIILLAGVVAITLAVNIASPYSFLMARAYPLADSAHPAPADFSFKLPIPPKTPQSPSGASEVDLLIPLQVISASKDGVFKIDAERLSIQNQSGLHWSSQWNAVWHTVWPGDISRDANFNVNRTVLNKFGSSPVTLHLSLAITAYASSGPHTVFARDGFFSIPGLGICKLGDRSFAAMVCREPIHHPSYIAEYSASESTCPPGNGTNAVSPQMTGNAFDFNDSSIGGVISPIVLSYITFEELPRPTGPSRTETHLHLCPGTPIQLATPVELGVSRVELQVSDVNLQDYVHEKSDGGTWGYYSLGFVH